MLFYISIVFIYLFTERDVYSNCSCLFSLFIVFTSVINDMFVFNTVYDVARLWVRSYTVYKHPGAYLISCFNSILLSILQSGCIRCWFSQNHSEHPIQQVH